MTIMKPRLEHIAGKPLGEPIEAFLTGPSLFDMFLDACERDYRRAVTCASPRLSRHDAVQQPTGCQRFVICDGFVRAPYASSLRYGLFVGTLAFDVFTQVVRRVNKLEAAVSLEFEEERLGAYSFNFG